MAFPTNPSPGDSYTDEYGTVWVYAGAVNGWYRQEVSTPNDTSYTAAISGPAGSNTQVQFNDNGELAGDSGLTYNKTTDALSGGAFIPTGSTIPTNGVYLPSANNVAISTNGTGKLFVDSSGRVLVGANSTSGASTFYDDIVVTNTTAGTGAGITLVANATNGFNAVDFGDTDAVGRGRITYSHADDSLRIDTAGSESLRITSDGKVGLGTSTPGAPLEVYAATNSELRLNTNADGYLQIGQFTNGAFIGPSSSDIVDGVLRLGTGGTERLRIDSTGKVGVGTTSPGAKLTVVESTANTSMLNLVGLNNYVHEFQNRDAGNHLRFYVNSGAPTWSWASNATEFARIDSSGRLLVGTSTDLSPGFTSKLQVATTSFDSSISLRRDQNANGGSSLLFVKTRGALGGNTIVLNNDSLGSIRWYGADGAGVTSAAAAVDAQVDGTPGANDMPGRLVFSTTADGASSPTERMRITSTGKVVIAGDIQFGQVGYLSETGPVSSVYTVNLGVTPNTAYASPRDVSIWTNDASVISFPRLTVKANGEVFMPAVYADTVGATNRDLYIDSGGKLGYVSSIRESKSNIADITDIDWLYQLNPVSFNRRRKDNQENYTNETYSELEYGLIAEDVETVAPELCFYDEVDGAQELRGIHYSKLIAPLLKAVQNLKAENEALKARVAALETP